MQSLGCKCYASCLRTASEDGGRFGFTVLLHTSRKFEHTTSRFATRTYLYGKSLSGMEDALDQGGEWEQVVEVYSRTGRVLTGTAGRSTMLFESSYDIIDKWVLARRCARSNSATGCPGHISSRMPEIPTMPSGAPAG